VNVTEYDDCASATGTVFGEIVGLCGYTTEVLTTKRSRRSWRVLTMTSLEGQKGGPETTERGYTASYNREA
jgi:hypothetical protein